MSRERLAKIDKHTTIDTLIKYKDHLIVDGQKIISKFDPIWATIAKELENRLTPISLYTFVSCNKHQVRDKLTVPLSLLINQWISNIFQMYRALLVILEIHQQQIIPR